MERIINSEYAFMRDYPIYTADNLEYFLSIISRERKNDVRAWNNLKNQFLSGRRNGRIPATATDVQEGDKLDDVVNDGAVKYTLVDVGGGVLKWDRRSLDVEW